MHAGGQRKAYTLSRGRNSPIPNDGYLALVFDVSYVAGGVNKKQTFSC